MVRRLLTGAFCLALFACSGGGDATGPDPVPPTHEPPAGPGKPTPNPAPGPGSEQPPPPPPPPVFNVTGQYGLTQINESQPGQMVLLSNPDGNAIGLYRFDASSALVLTDQQAWAFVILLEDDKNLYQIQNQGTFTRSGDNGEELTFESTLDGKVFSGHATDGSIVFTYDLDGDGAPDTELGFILKG